MKERLSKVPFFAYIGTRVSNVTKIVYYQQSNKILQMLASINVLAALAVLAYLVYFQISFFHFLVSPKMYLVRDYIHFFNRRPAFCQNFSEKLFDMIENMVVPWRVSLWRTYFFHMHLLPTHISNLFSAFDDCYCVDQLRVVRMHFHCDFPECRKKKLESF